MVRKPQSDFREDWSTSESFWQFPMGGKPETRQEWATWGLAWLGFIQILGWGNTLWKWLLTMFGWSG